MVIKIPLSQNGQLAGLYEAIIDDEDEELARFSWSVYVNQWKVRAYRKIHKKSTYLHRVVLERKLGRPIAEGLVAINLDHNGLNCTRKNLVEGTQGQANHLGQHDFGKTGHRGIQIYTNGKYVAYISVNNKPLNLGYFDSLEDAINRREEAEITFFGNLAQHLHGS